MLTDAGGKRKRVDRNAIAEKYLAVMEKQALKQHPTQQEREDRALRSAAHVDVCSRMLTYAVVC
jgi:hypothetical protein